MFAHGHGIRLFSCLQSLDIKMWLYVDARALRLSLRECKTDECKNSSKTEWDQITIF